MPDSSLLVGWSEVDITPDRPVELAGQYYQRLSTGVRDPLRATALALEGPVEDGHPNQAVLLEVDVVSVRKELIEELRERIRGKLADFNPINLIVNAIHTHNAPAPRPSRNWWKPDPRAIPTEEYRPWLLDMLERAVIEAWQARQPSNVSRRAPQVSVGHCRRALYADGSAEMYGNTNRHDFIGMEGTADPSLDLLYFLNAKGELTGVLANWACPAQVMEATYVVTADFAGELRRLLKQSFGENVHLLPLIGPSGDQSPRNLTRNASDAADMWNEPGMVQVGKRLHHAVAAQADAAREEAQDGLPFRHIVRPLRLPLRRVTVEEYSQAKAIYEALRADEPDDPDSPESAFNRFVAETRANEKKGGPGPYDSKLHDFVLMRNNEAVLTRWRLQQGDPWVPMELHALRLGDAALVNNPFELYLDYGHRMRAQSPAEQTFMAQLSGDALGYLPTARAVAAGGYGALVINGRVGPDGGDILVSETLEALHTLWEQ